MKEIFKLGFILFLITACAATILGFAHEITKGPIERQEQRVREEAMNQTLSQADKFEKVDVSLPEDSIIKEVNAGYKGNSLEGFAIKAAPKGYGGPVEIMVGINQDGVVQGIKILSHSETPGLGANAENDYFTSQFEGKSGQINVVKTKPSNDDEIQALTGATITSKAVTSGVNEVLDFLQYIVVGDDGSISINLK